MPAPVSASAAMEENYKNIVLMFQAAGFDNIQAEGAKDLITGLLTPEGTVFEISINGDTGFSKGELFPGDALVRIVFHSF